ncbi:LysR substrate-binding domain-containing protein, partial [Franconibacter helveticus]
DFILGALRNTRQAPDLASEVLFEEEMVILARNDHPLHKENALRDGLAQARWVLPRAGTPARLMLDAAFTALGVEAPRPVVETGDLAMVRGLLLHSDMLAAVSKSQLAWELEAGVLTALPVALPQTRRDIGLTFRAGSLPSPATEALLGYLRRCAREETFLYRQP